MQNPVRSLFILFAITVLISCSGSDDDSLPLHVREAENLVLFEGQSEVVYSIEINREQIFSDSLLLEEITGVAVWGDEIFFSGRSWNREEVFRFSRDGTLIHRFGNGEDEKIRFSSIRNLEISGDQLYLFDDGAGSVYRFWAEGMELTGQTELVETDLESFLLDGKEIEGLVPEPLFLIGEGEILAGIRDRRSPVYYDDRRRTYHSFSMDGNLIRGEVANLKASRYLIGDYAGRPAPFQLDRPERPLIAPFGSGMITADSEEFFIQSRNESGEIEHSWYLPVERASLDRHSVIHPRYSHNLQIRRVRESAEYPETWPVISSLLSDDHGRIWVSVITEDDEHLDWWVIEGDRLLATFSWPEDQPILHIKGDQFYTSEDDPTGFQDLVRYRFEFTDR